MLNVKVLQGFFLLVLVVVLSVAALLASSAFKWAGELPPISEIEKLEYTSTSQIFDTNDQVIGEILPVEQAGGATTNRTVVTLDKVSPAVLWAIISSEDDQFFKHYGFDVLALAKATYEEFLGGGGRGGSTLTTQVVKNTLLRTIAGEHSLERKLKEVMLAVELERRLTKGEILQQYLNVAYWGKNFYGIHAAAQGYFNKDPLELTLAEGLYLARLLPAPEPNYEDFKPTRQAMKNVLANMVKNGVISQETADRAWRQRLEPAGWDVTYDDSGEMVGAPRRTKEQPRVATTVASELNGTLAFAVRNEVERLFPGQLFRAGGLRIYTTIDSGMQRAANETAKDPKGYLPKNAQLALVSIDPTTGGIQAMVGGRDDGTAAGDTFNRAMSAKRQPGSSFKPFVVATAIESGGYTQATLVSDSPATFLTPDGGTYKPKNYDKKFDGIKTIRSHLDRSRNLPIVKLVEAVTPEAIVMRATQLGYENLLPVPSIGLGAFEVTPVRHAAAMAAFANHGQYNAPYLISKVTDADGNVLYEAKPQRSQVWRPATAYLMLDLLRGNVTDRDPYGFSNRAVIAGRWVGGKTGTTNNERDIWFVGLTPQSVSAVWVGFDEPRPLPKRLANGERFNSSRQPIWLWKDFAEKALSGKPAASFKAPPGIVFKKVDLATGVPKQDGTRVAFVRGTQPGAAAQPVASFMNITIPIDSRTNKRATANTPQAYLAWKEINPQQVQRYALKLPRVRPQPFPEGALLPPGSQPSDQPWGSGLSGALTPNSAAEPTNSATNNPTNNATDNNAANNSVSPPAPAQSLENPAPGGQGSTLPPVPEVGIDAPADTPAATPADTPAPVPESPSEPPSGAAQNDAQDNAGNDGVNWLDWGN